MTLNDSGDADSGPNNLQNFPVLTVAAEGANTTVAGTLNSAANTTYRLEFFSNTDCDSSGYGEGETYLGFTNVTTDTSGNVSFNATLSASTMSGQYISATATDASGSTSEFSACKVVGLPLPPSGPTTINYVYDPLNRLTEANYSNGDYYHYTYDAVGNRETQQKSLLGLAINDTFTYDDANRLTSVNGVNYTWDNNGNLLNDGTNTFTYDSANRLKSISNQSTVISYQYNGLGDRLQETVNGSTTTFTMDLNMGLTQALSDGTNTYIYGNDRIAQAAGTSTEYFLGDALGSVRQMTNQSGSVTYAKVYDPYGVVTAGAGTSQSVYGYTNEYTSQGLIYLRARYYASGMGRFLTQDSWIGDHNRPLSLNHWIYTEANPVNYTDPTGNITEGLEAKMADFFVDLLRKDYNVQIEKDWGYAITRLPASSLQPFGISGILFQCDGWQEGNWRSAREVQLVHDGVKDMSDKLGGAEKFKGAMWWMPISLKRMSSDLHSDGKSVAWTVLDIKIYNKTFGPDDEFAKGTLVHELAHVWDTRQTPIFMLSDEMWKKTKSYKPVCPSVWSLSCPFQYDPSGLEEAPTWYAKTGTREDFADSFAVCIYPSFRGAIQLGTIRRDHIEGFLNGNKCS